MDTLWLDLRYGVRSLVRTPGLTSVAVLMLALGIGANTVLFTVTEAVVFRPLPFEEPDRLVVLGRTSFANFVDWRDESRFFEGMTAFTEMSFSLTGEGQPERVLGAEVDTNFFSLLGVSPPLGRSFLEEEGEGRGQVVILSHGLWERRFGADPNVIGKTIRLEEEEPRSSVLRHGSFEVVGVAPALFQFPEGAEIWLPYAASERLKNIRKGNWLTAIGRLAAGATLGAARAEMGTIADRLEQEFPGESVFSRCIGFWRSTARSESAGTNGAIRTTRNRSCWPKRPTRFGRGILVCRSKRRERWG